VATVFTQATSRQRAAFHELGGPKLPAIGFAIVLLNFVPVSYFFTASHNF
jgi:hypothetical protein